MSLNPDKLHFHKEASGNSAEIGTHASLFAPLIASFFGEELYGRGGSGGRNDKFMDEYMCDFSRAPKYANGGLLPPKSVFVAGRQLGKSTIQRHMLEAMKEVDRCSKTNPCGEVFIHEGIHSALSALSVRFENKKGSNMSRFNVETLMALANIQEGDEFDKYDALPANIQTVLKRKLKEQEDQRLEDAADSIVYLLGATDEVINKRVAKIRELRRQVEQLKAEIAGVEAAKVYGMETQNFVPLSSRLGLVSGMAKGAQIPEGWTPKKAAVKK